MAERVGIKSIIMGDSWTYEQKEVGSIIHTPHRFTNSPNQSLLAMLSMQEAFYRITLPLNISLVRVPFLPCPLTDRALKINLPYSVDCMKLHWTPPEAYSGG
jgi:hypothetical protein